MAFLDDELVFQGDNKTMGGILQNFGNKLQTALRKSLDDNTSKGTSKQGRQSIKFDVQFKSLGVYRFLLVMDDYLSFIDEGVTGVGGTKLDGSIWAKKRTDGTFNFKNTPAGKPSADHFKGWANTKGANPFVVRDAVWHKGIKATHFYQNVVNDKIVAELADSLGRAGATGIELELVEVLKGEFK